MGVQIQIKRSYDEAQPEDGYRIFIDRLWPRGLSKSNFHYDLWCKDLAPSPALRKWFGHKPENWEQFQTDYKKELHTPEQQRTMKEVLQQSDKSTITLVYSAKDAQHNHALILAAEMQHVADALQHD